MNNEVVELLKEDAQRMALRASVFNPITGEGSIGERCAFELSDCAFPLLYIPSGMLDIPLVKRLKKARSIDAFLKSIKADNNEVEREKVLDAFVRIRMQFDFPFWAALLAKIKAKGGGDDVFFRLNLPQRKLISEFEEMRLAGLPIRVILLKARQWGGSTATQLYMAWLQLVHSVGLNSLIVGHHSNSSTEVKSMFERMISAYPTRYLHELGEAYNLRESKLVGVGQSGNIHRIPQRQCNIKVGTAESPDSARGGDYNLVHLTEVGLWKETLGKKPQDIVRSACSGVLLRALTMIVYESTANGVGNFFHIEYEAAKAGLSQFRAVFVSWFDIEQYSIELSEEARRELAERLLRGKDVTTSASDREESGAYLWWLWKKGATLSAIAWYISERSKYNDHGGMASEYPSDDVEAFVHSGRIVFDRYQVESFRNGCRAPKWKGEIYGGGTSGEESLSNIRFSEEIGGGLWVWAKPDVSLEEKIENRYVVAVDIGGRGAKADWSVVVVIDRLNLLDGERPSVVAQWRGHIDHDLLAWKAAQIAKWYDDALLVIESNTLETKDRERSVDGDQSGFILNLVKDAYPNLYARKRSPEDIREGAPVKYGFHTNTATKPAIISHLQSCVREHLWTERDSRALDELLCYEQKQNGSFGAIVGKHDDILMTRAIGLWVALREMELPRIVKNETKKVVATRKVVSAATL